MNKTLKQKRAFTLVELLAVIVILGLLFALTVPAISRYINETREKNYSLHEADMKTAASNLMSECVQKNDPMCLPEDGETKVVYLDELVEKKYSKKIKDPDDTDKFCDMENSYVVVSNSTNNVVELDYQVCLVCSNYKSDACDTIDTGPTCDPDSDADEPTCDNIVGASTIWTNRDRVISVDCKDNGCGCKRETFYQTYTETAKTEEFIVEDETGKTGKCEVNVYIDKVAPTCSIKVSSYGSLGDSGWYGGTAPIVEITDMDDNLSGIATYGVGTSKNNPDFNKDKEYEVSPGVSMIYGYVKDEAGNVGTCSVEVKYDNVKPTGEVTFGYQVYPKDDISSKSGSTISFNSNTVEFGEVVGLKVTLSSNASGMTTTLKNGTSTIVSRTISSGVTEMLYTFSANTYNSLALDMGSSSNANLVQKVELITDHTLKSGADFYTNQDVKVYISSQDSFSGKAKYSFDGGSSWQTSNEKTYSTNSSISILTQDSSGNNSDEITGNINNIDKLKPSCVLKRERDPFLSNKDWYNSTINVLFDSTDDADSTSQYARSTVRDYSFNSNGLGTKKTSTQSTATDGTLHIGYVVDKAGNINTCSTNIKLDGTNPVPGTITMRKNNSSGTVIGDDAKVNTKVYVTLNNGNDTGSIASGHYTTKYTVKRDGTTVTTDATGANTYSTEGVYTVTVTTTDNSGRTSNNTYTFMIDVTKPNCGTSASYPTWINTDRTTSVGCSDSASGCTQTSYSQTFTSTMEYGSITIYDVAGNSQSCSVDVRVDKVRPTCGSSTTFTTWVNTDRTNSVTCTDSDSGCSKSSFSNTFTATAETGVITITDAAGNSQSCSVDVLIDKISPTCTTKGGGTTWVNTDVTITGTCSDTGGSGCKADVSKKYTSDTNTTSANPGTVYDNAGNSGSCGNATVKIDKSPPTCTTSGGGNTWVNTNVTITGTCSDTGGSGCKANSTKTYSSNTNTTTANPGAVYDNAGNSANCGNATVKIDKTPPTCTVSGGGSSWSYSAVTVTGTCSDTGGSECKANVSSTISNDYNSTVSPGTVYDNAGNSAACGSATVKVDTCYDPTVSYGGWSDCSVSCGTGTQSATVYSTGISGRDCGSTTTTQSCTKPACQHTHSWKARGSTSFKHWSKCYTLSCGECHSTAYPVYCTICGMSARYYSQVLGGSGAATMVCDKSPYGPAQGWQVWSGDTNATDYQNHSSGCFNSGAC